MEGLAILCFLVALVGGTEGRAHAEDITCINNQLGHNPVTGVSLIAVGDDIQPISFGRYRATGENQKKMPNATRMTIADDIEVLTLDRPPRGKSESPRTGIFQCRTIINGNNITIPIPVVLGQAGTTPRSFLSKTINAGEDIRLTVKSNVRNVHWRKDDVEIPQWHQRLVVVIKSATVDDSGVYECYSDRDDPHAIMRLIVRRCPANFIGDNCDTPCFCYNGGVCRNDGICICPPGFSGELCEVLHTSENFGKNGQFRCSDIRFRRLGFENDCRGELFCLPDPFGCTCAPGYRGTFCQFVCLPNTFGANCLQRCHCAAGSACDRAMGVCSPPGCEKGWTGENCNERITCRHNPCQNGGVCRDSGINTNFRCTCRAGYTGETCEDFADTSPCASEPCLNGTTCVNGEAAEYTCTCADGFEGIDCETAASALAYREDNRCGGNWRAPNGEVAQCDPDGRYPCCSGYNWCGITRAHCYCQECIDYRRTVIHRAYREDIRCGGNWRAPNGEVAQCDPDGRYPCCSPYNWCGFTSAHCNCERCIDYRRPEIPCDSGPCLNGATCVEGENRDYTCTCALGFEGTNCVTNTCKKPCPRIYAPVCGSDGRTYDNQCAFEVSFCMDKTAT